MDFLERKTFDGVLHYRNDPNAEFKPLSPKQLTDIIFVKDVQLNHANDRIKFLENLIEELEEEEY